MNKTAVLNELMNTQHRKALLQKELELLGVKETFLSQEYKLFSGATPLVDIDMDDVALEEAPTKKTAKTNPKAVPAKDLDLDDNEDEDDDIPVTKSKKKSAALDLDDEDETPAPKQKSSKTSGASASSKKGAKVEEELEETSDDDDLDDFLGTEPGKTETAPTIGPDQVRKLLSTIVREKGEKGKAAARKVMVKYTKGGTAQVKDMLAGSHHKAYAQLQKI